MQIENYIRAVPDFPKAGILFRDIAPLLACPEAFDSVIERFATEVQDGDIIIGLDARGFIFASALAARTGNPFVMIRKPGKLP